VSALLELHNITAGYTEDITILHDISVRVEEGHLTGLIGLNGAGKSTLIKTIYGFLYPRNGSVVLDDEDITGIPPHTMIDRHVWYIPQESSLFPYLSVEDNLRVLARRLRSNSKPLSKPEIVTRISEVFEEFPVLQEKRRQQAGDLSGGQQKMLEFAKALLAQPRLCLIDEPTVGLAPKIAEEVYTWIERFISNQMTIFLIDHNVRRVVQMADYIYVLSLGRITDEGPRSGFQANLHEQVKQWLGINL
jgi:ABC-type branched-subunit amino acid transport system ATPase component